MPDASPNGVHCHVWGPPVHTRCARCFPRQCALSRLWAVVAPPVHTRCARCFPMGGRSALRAHWRHQCPKESLSKGAQNHVKTYLGLTMKKTTWISPGSVQYQLRFAPKTEWIQFFGPARPKANTKHIPEIAYSTRNRSRSQLHWKSSQEARKWKNWLLGTGTVRNCIGYPGRAREDEKTLY